MYGPQLPKTGLLMFFGIASFYNQIFVVFFILMLALIVFSYTRLRYREYIMRKKNVL